MLNIETIFKLIPYSMRYRHCRYPTIKLHREAPILFRSVEEAERDMLAYNRAFPYCYALSELPVGVQHLAGDSFSERVYLPDGEFWGGRLYAKITPLDIPPQYGEIEFDNYIYGSSLFRGRKQEEIHFKRGDIIEIFCYSGNNYWSDGYVELAIVVDSPPTEKEMAKRFEQYLSSEKSHLTGNRGFDLGIQFNAHDDAYTVIPAYLPAHTDPAHLLDHCPTHCALRPCFEISAKTRAKLERMLETFEKNVKIFPAE